MKQRFVQHIIIDTVRLFSHTVLHSVEFDQHFKKNSFPLSAYGKWDEYFCSLANEMFIIIPTQPAYFMASPWWTDIVKHSFPFLRSRINNKLATDSFSYSLWQYVDINMLRWSKKKRNRGGGKNDLIKLFRLFPFSSSRKVESSAS